MSAVVGQKQINVEKEVNIDIVEDEKEEIQFLCIKKDLSKKQKQNLGVITAWITGICSIFVVLLIFGCLFYMLYRFLVS